MPRGGDRAGGAGACPRKDSVHERSGMLAAPGFQGAVARARPCLQPHCNKRVDASVETLENANRSYLQKALP